MSGKKEFANICQYKTCICKAVKSGPQRLEYRSIKGTEKLKLISPEKPRLNDWPKTKTTPTAI